MFVNFSSVFTEVNTKFKVSFKVHKLLMKLLTNLDLQAKLPMSKTNRDAIGFVVSTNRHCVEIEDMLLSKYLENLEIASLIGFSKLYIEDERISKVFSLVKKEVIGNKEYENKATLT